MCTGVHCYQSYGAGVRNTLIDEIGVQKIVVKNEGFGSKAVAEHTLILAVFTLAFAVRRIFGNYAAFCTIIFGNGMCVLGAGGED